MTYERHERHEKLGGARGGPPREDRRFRAGFFGALAALCIVPSVVFLTLDPGARHTLRTLIIKEARP